MLTQCPARSGGGWSVGLGKLCSNLLFSKFNSHEHHPHNAELEMATGHWSFSDHFPKMANQIYMNGDRELAKPSRGNTNDQSN